MSFKILDSYTTCTVWLTFCIVVKRVQWSCTLKIPWKKKYLYWRNMLLYIPSNKKQYSCKRKFCRNTAIHSLMRFGLIIMFFPWHLLLEACFRVDKELIFLVRQEIQTSRQILEKCPPTKTANKPLQHQQSSEPRTFFLL